MSIRIYSAIVLRACVGMALGSVLVPVLGAQNIHTAALERDYAGVARALEEGASPNSYNLSGFAPLHSAARGGSGRIAELLLDNGADINIVATNSGQDTPLHIATINGNIGIVTLLVARGANLDLQNAAGNTALHESARFGNSAIVRALVLAGANRDIVNNNGETAAGLGIGDSVLATQAILARLNFRWYSTVGSNVSFLLAANASSSAIVGGVSGRAGAMLEFSFWVPLGVSANVDLLFGENPHLVTARLYGHVFPLLAGVRAGPVMLGGYFDLGGTFSTANRPHLHWGFGAETLIDLFANSALYGKAGINFDIIDGPDSDFVSNYFEVGWSWWLGE